MTLWILDTDHVSFLIRDHPTVKRQIARIDPEAIATTIVTVEEQLRGRFEMIRRAGSEPTLVMAYARLGETFLFLQMFNPPLAFNQDAYHRYLALKQQRIRIGSQDLKIASIALSVGGTVVTRNRRDFEQVPELKIADWSLA